MWVHSVEVARPADEIWRRLAAIECGQFSSASAPLILKSGDTLQEEDQVEISGGPKDFVATISRRGASFRVTLQVDPKSTSVALQGAWWFRGEFGVQSLNPQRTKLVLEIYNVAGAPWHLLVPLVTIGVKDQTHKDLTALAEWLDSRPSE